MRIYLKITISIILILGGIIFYAKKSEEIKTGAKSVLKKANLWTVCDETLYYSLGDIDPKFNISEEEIKKILLESEAVWEKDLNKNVFEYKEGAEFKINFIFDERQQGTIEKDSLNGQLDELAEHKDNISKEYQILEDDYNKKTLVYEKNIKIYEEQANDFNQEVKKINKEGKLSSDEYEKLKKKEKELEKLRNDIKGDRININKMVAQLNILANKESSVVKNYNNKIETYKERFGESREFNQGEYSGVGINIYQFHEKNDLKLVLAHEFGHALEIEHIENPASVMYYLMEKQDLENVKLTEEDLGAIKRICKIE